MGLPFLGLDHHRLVLVGNHLARFHNRIDQVGHAEPPGQLREVRTGCPPFPAKPVTEHTASRGEGLLPVGKVTPLQPRLGDLENLGARPVATGAGRLGKFRGRFGLAGPQRLNRQSLGVAGVLVGVPIHIAEEALEAVAPRPLPRPGKPLEIRPPRFGGPARLQVPQRERRLHLLDLGLVGQHRSNRSTVAAVPVDQVGQSGVARLLLSPGDVSRGNLVARVGETSRRPVRLALGQLGHSRGRHPGRLQEHQQVQQFAIERRVGGGVRRLQPGDHCLAEIVIGSSQADEGQLQRPQHPQPLTAVEARRVEAAQRHQDGELVFAISLPGEGNCPQDDSVGVLRLQHPIAPGLDGLVFERDPGGVADVPIGVAQVRKDLFHHLGRVGLRGMERLELAAQRPQFGPRHVVGVDGIGRLGAGVGHAVQFRLRAAATHREVQGPVEADGVVGQRQRTARHELFFHRAVRRSLGLNMNGVHRSEGPVADIQRLLVLRREPRAVPKLDTHGGARADVHQRGQAVEVVGGPLARPAPPAKLTAAGGVHHPRGAIPRRAEVPLHVGVVGEQLAIGVERHVVLVAIARRENLPRLPLGVGLGDPAPRGQDARGMTVRVPLPGEQQVFVPVGRQPAGHPRRGLGPQRFGAGSAHHLGRGVPLDVERRQGVVATNHHQALAIG